MPTRTVRIRVTVCPHCGSQYERNSSANRIGNPLATCGNCRKGFINRDFNEWELKTPNDQIKIILPTLIWVIVGLIVVGGFSAAAAQEHFALPLLSKQKLG